MHEERDFDNSPPSSTLKPILVVVGALAGLMILVLGGAAGYVAIRSPAHVEVKTAAAERQPPREPDLLKQFHDKKRAQKVIPLTHDAQAVTSIAATIFKIDLPADFAPRDAEQELSVTRAVFNKQSDDAALLKMALTEWLMPNGGAPVSPDDPQVRQALKLVEADYGSRSETTLKATRQETKTFQRELTILGKKAIFTFKQGKRALDNKPVWKIWGGFGATNGLATMILLLPESEFDEEAVVRMLEGIRDGDELPSGPRGNLPAEPSRPAPPAE